MGKPTIRFEGYTDDWEQRKFSDCYKMSSGYAFKMSDYCDEGVGLINGESIQHGIINDDNLNHLPESFVQHYPEFLLKENDIVVGLNRPITNGNLKIARIPSKYNDSLLYQRAGKIVYKTDCDKDFTYVLLSQEILKHTLVEAVGSDQPFISTSKLDGWKMMMPSDMEEQVKIGEYFQNLDHLITLHQRKYINGKKEELLAWEQRKLIDLVDVLDGDRGKNYPTSDDFDISGHTLFLNASNVTNDGFLFQDNQFITEEKSNSMGNGKLEEDDIVVTSRGSLGHIAWYNADISSLVPYARINSGMLILRNKKEIETEYLYHFMKSSKGQSQISFISFGSAQPQLTKKGVEALEVILPTRRDEQVQLGHYFSDLDHLITLHQHKCEELQNIKKFMLQNMFI